jgi:hypothetical protein
MRLAFQNGSGCRKKRPQSQGMLVAFSEYIDSKRNLPRLFSQIAIPALSNSQLFCTIRGSPGKESPAICRLRGAALANPRE